MNKIYSIYIDGVLIGTTQLEKADAPMGVVFGEMKSEDKIIDYNFIKDFCKSKNIELTADYPDDKLISTKTIESLSVQNEKGIEIKGLGNEICGMDSAGFEIILVGIPYPFYEEEFPHHVKFYNDMFKE